jgi:hypothetical protein
VKTVLNLNDKVRVRLTADGARAYNEYMAQFKLRRLAPELVEGQEITTQLWDLMATFGPRIHMGMKPLFEGLDVEVLP